MGISKKKRGFLLFLILILGLFSGCQTQTTKAAVRTEEIDLSVYPKGEYFITAQEVKELIGRDDLVLLDCNKPDLYEKEHIKGAIGIGFHAFSNKVGKPGDLGWGTLKSKEDLADKLVELGIDNQKTVVFYSNVFKGPGADGRAVWQLSQAGMDNVKILLGGTTYWKELGYEMTSDLTETPVASDGVILKDYDSSFCASKESIFNNLGQEFLLDVRTEKEYKGSQNAGEPRGGHIAGADHLLWTDFLEENGVLKSPQAIESIMTSLNVSKDDDFTLY